MTTRRVFANLCFLLTLSFPIAAQEEIPAPLKLWESWVLDGNENLTCPFINNTDYKELRNHLCAWPSALTINANEQGAVFEQSWEVLTESIVPLLGDNENWPSAVSANSRQLPIIKHNGSPAVKLVQGKYTLKGQLNWKKVPSSINIPNSYSLVNLYINEQEVPFPKIEGRELWFQKSEQNESVQDTIEVNVVRRVSDGPYIELDTRLEVNVSGKSREVILGHALPEGFKLIGVEGEVPAFLDAEGLLHAKLKPGYWEIRIQAHALPEHLSWKRTTQSHHWPKDEVWVFATDEKMRIGKLSGANVVDSSQAEMPNNWYDLPSYLLTTEDTLTYDIQHRGKPVHLENQLNLERTLWVSFDNSLYTFNDRIQGKMIEGWRLSMPAPFVLESAEDQDGSVLITTLEEAERGVENRYPDLNIKARGVIDFAKQLPITGWDSDFERVSITLNVPPGNKLFAVFGADRATDSWWGNWSIWASFIVLLASIAASRLISIPAGIATGIMLLMIYQESGAPVITILNLLIAITVHKHQPFERIKPWVNAYWMTSVLIAIGAILFFSATQIRTVIHPQLESKNSGYSVDDFSSESIVFGEVQDAVTSNIASRSSEQSDSRVEKIQVTGSRVRSADLLMERYQSDALIQAGSGVPNWQWNRHTISWSSPVAKGQTFDIIILSDTIYRLLKVISIIIIILWLYLVSKDALISAFARLKQQHVATALALFILSPLYSPTVEASDLPNQALLEELKARLTEAPLCAPQCASINYLDVTTSSGQLSLTLSIHATTDTAIALPRSEFWRAEALTLNQKPLLTMIKVAQWVYIPVPQGISELTMTGRVAPVDSFQLQFREQPQRLTIQPTDAWEIVGDSDNVLSGNSLEFLATVKQQQNDEQASTRYNTQPFVRVNRTLSIDQLWRVTTEVKRVAPALGSVNIRIPLLEGERVISGDTKVEDNHAIVTIPAGEDDFSWTSTLERREVTTFKATRSQHYIEQWQLISSPSWHTEFSGLPMILEEQAGNDYFTYSFYPYADEILTINTTRPNAVKGDVLAIDSVMLDIDHGTRTSVLTLSFAYRSTRGGEHLIDLPSEYQLKEVKTDNRLVNLQPESGQLSIPIVPGEHNVQIVMRATVAEELLFSPPSINLNAPSSNVTTKINMNNQRWILWVDGPLLGPAILYWVEFLAFIMIALLLSRVKFSPLSTLSWIILGVGLSLNNWGTLMLTAVWFASLTASKYRSQDMNQAAFNLSQLVLFGLSIVTVITLIAIVPISLLSTPSMGIEGYHSYGNHLSWFADKTDGMLPSVSVLSISTWFYKAIMLVWVIWLSISFISWIKWAWRAIGQNGYWQSTPNKENINSKE